MNPKHRLTIAVIAALALATAGMAQFGPRMGPPSMRGKWAPAVGQGATYSVESKGKTSEVYVAIVGSEQHEGKTGHWMEIVGKDPSGGEAIMKFLVVVTGGQRRNVRVIMQGPGQPPMEISMEMMQMMPGMVGRQQNNEADITETGTRVGTETITVPAGTFTAEHWKSKDGADAWISEKAGPFQMVKYVSPESTMILTKLVSDATTRIKGTPQKMEMPRM